jgi:hypothetical protein
VKRLLICEKNGMTKSSAAGIDAGLDFLQVIADPLPE